jgi:hypothetical protein
MGATPGRAAAGGARLYATVGAAITALALFPFTAKPITWDELVYMGLAFYPEPRGWVLNRYAHIYAMKPFMWLAGDPYVGARAYWSALLGITVGAFIWAALQLPGARGAVLALALVLLAGQQTLFASAGVAYADFAIMAVITVALVLVLVRIVRAEDLSGGDAAALGALFLVGMKAKETALPLLALAGPFFIAPSGRLRVDRTAVRLVRCWLLGAAVALLGILALDGILLGDPLFSLRPWAWRRVFEYFRGPSLLARDRLAWMPQPPPYLSFALYAGAGLPWLWRARDPRLLLVYLLPGLFVLMITLVVTAYNAPPRYVIPVLPGLCLLAALACVGVLSQWRDTRSGRLAVVLATIAIVAAACLPMAQVASALIGRDVQRRGEVRFAGFRQVARAVQVGHDDVVFVSSNLYGGAIRPGVVAALTRMNFNAPLPAGHIVAGDTPPADADYAVLDFDEYGRWLSTPGADPARAVVSADQAVALVCLRGACPRR